MVGVEMVLVLVLVRVGRVVSVTHRYNERFDIIIIAFFNDKSIGYSRISNGSHSDAGKLFPRGNTSGTNCLDNNYLRIVLEVGSQGYWVWTCHSNTGRADGQQGLIMTFTCPWILPVN